MFFRYPGGKTKIKNDIIGIVTKNINKNTLYIEPFFGGGGIGINLILKNNLPKQIAINDRDAGISCLWTSVIKYPDKLKESIMSFVPSIENFYSFKEELLNTDVTPLKEDSIIDIGFKKLAIHQTSYSGLGVKSGSPLGGKEQKSQYKIDCRWSPNSICKKIDTISNKFSKIQIHENMCFNTDFSYYFYRFNCNKDVFLYLDPPYYIKGNDLYQHGFNDEDHARLCHHLENTNHKWILSYDDCDEIREMYSWANIISFDVKYTIKSGKNGNTKKELLICKNINV